MSETEAGKHPASVDAAAPSHDEGEGEGVGPAGGGNHAEAVKPAELAPTNHITARVSEAIVTSSSCQPLQATAAMLSVQWDEHLQREVANPTGPAVHQDRKPGRAPGRCCLELKTEQFLFLRFEACAQGPRARCHLQETCRAGGQNSENDRCS